MRILFVTSEAHVSGVGGGVTYTRGMLSLLQTIGGVNVAKLVLRLPLKDAPQVVRQGYAMARSLFSPLPSKAHYLLDTRSRRRLRIAIRSEEPDVIVLNGCDLLPLVDEIPRLLPCLLISHNVETDIISGQAGRMRLPPVFVRMLERDIRKTRRMEEEGARRVTAICTISNDDADWYRRLSPDLLVQAIPGVFSYAPYNGPRPPARRPLQVAYLAKLAWWPNREGAEWFLSAVLSNLPVGTIEAHFFGPGSEAFAGRHPAVHVHGFVDRLDTVWRSGSFTICPALAGSGINIKLAESLYNGVPVLATPHAYGRLPPIDDPAIAVIPQEEWVEFLGSERAMVLASASVRPETAGLFSAHQGAERLSEILSRVLQSRV